MVFFLTVVGGHQCSPFVAKSLSRSLSSLAKPVSYQDRQSAQLYTVPLPFTARFQGTLVADDVTTVLVPE